MGTAIPRTDSDNCCSSSAYPRFLALLMFSRTALSVVAHHLRPFLRHDGIHGVFELEFSAAGELLDLRQLQ